MEDKSIDSDNKIIVHLHIALALNLYKEFLRKSMSEPSEPSSNSVLLRPAPQNYVRDLDSPLGDLQGQNYSQ